LYLRRTSGTRGGAASSRSLKSSAKKMSSPAPTAVSAAASIRKSPGPSCAPCATGAALASKKLCVEGDDGVTSLQSVEKL
jgi:hypothetical protein